MCRQIPSIMIEVPSRDEINAFESLIMSPSFLLFSSSILLNHVVFNFIWCFRVLDLFEEPFVVPHVGEESNSP